MINWPPGSGSVRNVNGSATLVTESIQLKEKRLRGAGLLLTLLSALFLVSYTRPGEEREEVLRGMNCKV